MLKEGPTLWFLDPLEANVVILWVHIFQISANLGSPIAAITGQMKHLFQLSPRIEYSNFPKPHS